MNNLLPFTATIHNFRSTALACLLNGVAVALTALPLVLLLVVVL